LLAGPRGRRLCWALLKRGDFPGWSRLWHGVVLAGDLTGLEGELAECVARTDLAAIAAGTSEVALLGALAEAVDGARYWQEPDEEDRALAGEQAREALLSAALAVTAAPAARWWASAFDAAGQRFVEFIGEYDFSPVLTGTAAALAAWRSDTLDDERRARERPEDPAALYSGHWWSAPSLSGLPFTTRTLPGIGAAGLALVEDGPGLGEALCWPVTARPGIRVYEIAGPGAWSDLVSRYPLDVSRARRHDWWRTTGLTGTWLIPDYAAVAADYDAVHLSVGGYLTTAGRALPAGGGRTVLAGWSPDETYWLADVLSHAGTAKRWISGDDGWVRADPGGGV
jgi:hypothetical protein